MKTLVRHLLALLSLSALLLTACGGPAATTPTAQPTAASVPTQGSQEAPTSAPAPTTDAAPAPTTAANESSKIVYWSYWTEAEPQAKVLQGWIDEFQKANPNITVEVKWNGRQNQTLVRTALLGGEKIDLVDAGSDELASGLLKDGALMPLNEYLTKPSLDDPSKTVGDVVSKGALTQYAVEDKIYVMPYNAYTVQLWYNKKAFEKAGIAQTPGTWEEFLETNKKLKDAGYKPIVIESDIASYQQIWLGYYIQRAKGCQFLLDTMGDKTGEKWKDPVYAEATKAIRGLWEAGYIPEEATGNLFPAGQQTLGLGESAMELVGSWLPNEIKDIAQDNVEWGSFNFPSVPGGQNPNTDLMGGTGGMSILNLSPNKDAAFEFIRFFTTKAQSTKYSTETVSGVPVIGVDWPGPLADGSKAMADAKVMFGWFCDAGVAYPDYVNNLFNVNWTDFFVGKTSGDEFIDKMVTDSKAFWEAQE